MAGRLDQARSRAQGVLKRRMAFLAERVANGQSVSAAGAALGLTRGETARAWANIKRDLGNQAR